MNVCNLIKLMGQYSGKNFQPCRSFQYEVTVTSKWSELIHVKGSLTVHAPPLESNLAGAQPCPQIFLNFILECSCSYMQVHTFKSDIINIWNRGMLVSK